MSLKEQLTEQERAVRRAVREGVDEVAENTLSHMRRRTRSDRDIQARPFTEYSPSYARQKYGSRSQRRPVNLTRSGDMLAALQVRPATERGESYGRTVALGRPDMDRRGRFHQDGTRRMPQRRWFGTTRRFEGEQTARFLRRVRRALPRGERRTITISFSM